MRGSEQHIYSRRLVRLQSFRPFYAPFMGYHLNRYLSASTPPWGKISDIFGRKPILLAAIAIFFIGSLIGALANDIGTLIAGRVIQGTGGGGIFGLSVTVVGDVFSPR